MVKRIQDNNPTLYANAALRSQKYNNLVHNNSSTNMNNRKAGRFNNCYLEISARSLACES